MATVADLVFFPKCPGATLRLELHSPLPSRHGPAPSSHVSTSCKGCRRRLPPASQLLWQKLHDCFRLKRAKPSPAQVIAGAPEKETAINAIIHNHRSQVPEVDGMHVLNHRPDRPLLDWRLRTSGAMAAIGWHA